MATDNDGDNQENTVSAIEAQSIDDNEAEERGRGQHLIQPLISGANNPLSSRIQSISDDINSSEIIQDDGEDAEYVLMLDNDNGNDFDSAYLDQNNYQDLSYSLDPQRYAILVIFCLNNLLGSAVWITFAPIEDAVEAKFRQFDFAPDETDGIITDRQINWLSMISMAVYAPGTALCAWAIPKYGFRETVIASSIVMTVGCLFRWWSLSSTGRDVKNEYEDWSSPMPRYFILLTGQALVALGQTIFQNAPARVAASWFQQTTKPIGAINLCSNFGIILGQSLSPIFVVEETGEHLDQLLAGQGIAMGMCALFTGFCFRYEEPPLPPSAAEAARRKERHQQQRLQEYSFSSSAMQHVTFPSTSISKDIKKLLTNPQYVILLFALGIEYGLNSAVITLMQSWVASSGFPGDEIAGLCGSLLTVGGVLGTAIAAILLDATRNYNQAIRWSFAAMFLAGIGLVAALQPGCPIWLLAVAFTITGMTQMPLLTICLDAAAAHTYPVSEELSSAGLQLVGCYLGMFLVDGMAGLMETPSNNNDDENNDHKYGFAAKVNIAYLILLGFSSIIACCYKSDDPRANVRNDGGIIQGSGTLTTTSTAVFNNSENINDNDNDSDNSIPENSDVDGSA